MRSGVGPSLKIRTTRTAPTVTVGIEAAGITTVVSGYVYPQFVPYYETLISCGGFALTL